MNSLDYELAYLFYIYEIDKVGKKTTWLLNKFGIAATKETLFRDARLELGNLYKNESWLLDEKTNVVVFLKFLKRELANNNYPYAMIESTK